jgi:hypothetical protein
VLEQAAAPVIRATMAAAASESTDSKRVLMATSPGPPSSHRLGAV